MRPRRRDAKTDTLTRVNRSSSYRNLINPFEPARIFSDDQVESIHLTALGMLERQGMRVLSARGRTALAAAGAKVDDSTQMVYVEPGMVAQALRTVPAEVELVARNPARSCRVGGRHVVFAPVAG